MNQGDTPLQIDYGHHLVDEVLAGRMTRRDFVRRATVFGLSMSSIASLLMACGGNSGTTGSAASPSSAPPATRGGTMRVAMVPPNAAVNPVTMYDAGAIAVAQQVSEYLIWMEPDLSLRPVLAEHWTSDAKAQTWTFTLRKGVTFSDGRPFTADDVVYTFKLISDPKGDSNALTNFTDILVPNGVFKKAEDVVEFHLETPFIDFPYLVAAPNYNALVLPNNYDPQKYATAPVGTGPFILESYAVQEHATFKRNPNYWQQGLPYLDGVTLQFYQDDPPQILALQGGTVDMMLSTPYQGSQAILSDPNIRTDSVHSSQFREVGMRGDKSPFTDKRVRQAIAYTLDRPALLQGLFQGKGEIGNDTIFAPIFPISPTIPQRSQNYDLAKQLLAQAGYQNGIDITLTAEIYLEVVQYATLIQAMAKPAGIRIHLDQMPSSTFYGSGPSAPYMQVPFSIIDFAARGIPSQIIVPLLKTNGVYNNMRWSDPRFDKLSDQLEATLDETTRRSIAKQMALMEQDATPCIVAYWIDALRSMAMNVHGVKADGSEFLDLSRAYLS